jgi:hypothetical protein
LNKVDQLEAGIVITTSVGTEKGVKEQVTGIISQSGYRSVNRDKTWVKFIKKQSD